MKFSQYSHFFLGKFISFNEMTDEYQNFSNETFDLIIDEAFQENIKKNVSLNLNFSTFQECVASSSQNNNKISYSFATLIENFSDFEENLKNSKKNKNSVIFFFNTNEEANNYLQKFSHILDKFSANIEYFYYITYLIEIPESELRDKVFLPAPCLLVYFGQIKHIEMSLDILGENLFQILRKIESSLTSESKKTRNLNEIAFDANKKYNLNAVNEKYFKFIEKMLKNKFIIEKEYYFLKSLYFQEIQIILNNCFDSLM